MGISLVIHLVTAYFNVGFYSADEQFQILEFLGYKLGKVPVANLAMEFREQMRPWTQIGLYWVVVQFLKLVQIKSPFIWVFGIRLVTGLIGWSSSVAMAFCSRVWFKDVLARRFSIVCIALLWFLPCLHVRPSSESLGGSAFLLGLCIACIELAKLSKTIMPRTRYFVWICVGLLFGLSFESRFQMGLMIVGLFAWMLFYSHQNIRVRFRLIGATCFGLALFVALGRCVDFWGYGVWAFSPWNYFKYNIVRGEVDRFNKYPWWDIIRVSFTESWPILGSMVVICSVIAWVRHPKHPLTWSHLPFFIVHEWIGHKEFRFFFPLAMASPPLITMAFYSAKTHRFFRFAQLASGVRTSDRWLRHLRKPGKVVWDFLVLNNIIALIALMFIPFSRKVLFYEAVYKALPKDQSETELYFQKGTGSPYEVLGIQIGFYRPNGLKLIEFGGANEFTRIMAVAKKPILVYYPNFELPEAISKELVHCSLIFRTLPPYIRWFNISNWLSHTIVWSLYQCK